MPEAIPKEQPRGLHLTNPTFYGAHQSGVCTTWPKRLRPDLTIETFGGPVISMRHADLVMSLPLLESCISLGEAA